MEKPIQYCKVRMVWGGRREGGSGWGAHVYLKKLKKKKETKGPGSK